MLLLLDNYDSFTYNLYQYLGELGADTRVVRNDELTAEEALALRPERIVISPGPGTPDQSGITLELIRRSAGRVPLLGVCLGHQALGQAFGGRVVRAPLLMLLPPSLLRFGVSARRQYRQSATPHRQTPPSQPGPPSPRPRWSLRPARSRAHRPR